MQYNMLIAEDEQDEFELVLYLLKKLGLENAFHIFHAKNGKQALALLEQETIDVLFTDIEMPFANGLELANRAREKNAELPIVFFSCYDDFSYIKTALTVKACNYLLKPLDPAEFEKTIRETLDQIHHSEKEKVFQEKRAVAAKNHYLYQLLTRGTVDASYLNELGMSEAFTREYTRLLLLHFETEFFDQSQEEADQFADNLNTFFQTSLDVVNLNPFQSVLLLREKYEEGGHKSEEELEKLCESLRKEIWKRYRAEAYFVISGALTEENGLVQAFEHAGSLLEIRFFDQQHFVFCEGTNQMLLCDQSERCSQVLEEIERDLETQNLEKLQLDIRRINQIFEQSKNFSHIFVRYTYSQLVQILYKDHELREIQQVIEKIFSCSFIYEIEKIMEEVVTSCYRDMVEEEDGKNRAVLFVRQYISDHYMEQISLNGLAEMVYLNASYLSSVFKLETGSGINEYIKKVRMEKARQILEQTNKKVSSIAKEVGFSNTSYFIKSFHEYYGETPAKIRQM